MTTTEVYLHWQETEGMSEVMDDAWGTPQPPPDAPTNAPAEVSNVLPFRKRAA